MAFSAIVLVVPRPTELIGLGVLGVLTGAWSAAGWWLAAVVIGRATARPGRTFRGTRQPARA